MVSLEQEESVDYLYSVESLDQAVVFILGDNAMQHRNKISGELYWGDALLHCAEYSFTVKRPEDEHSEIVRYFIGLLNEDLELPDRLFSDNPVITANN